MARANRHHLPGYVWHITHRCHKKDLIEAQLQERQQLLEQKTQWPEMPLNDEEREDFRE